MDILTVRASCGLKHSGRAFQERGAQVRTEDKGEGIPAGKNNRGEGGGVTHVH